MHRMCKKKIKFKNILIIVVILLLLLRPWTPKQINIFRLYIDDRRKHAIIKRHYNNYTLEKAFLVRVNDSKIYLTIELHRYF